MKRFTRRFAVSGAWRGQFFVRSDAQRAVLVGVVPEMGMGLEGGVSGAGKGQGIFDIFALERPISGEGGRIEPEALGFGLRLQVLSDEFGELVIACPVETWRSS